MAMPFSSTYPLFLAAAATANANLVDPGSASAIQLSVTTTGFSGTLDIQGRLDPSDTFVNLQYVTLVAGSLTPAVAQLSYSTQTATTTYVAIAPMPYMRIVMTRSAGTITMYGRGYSEPFALPVTTTGGVAATDLGKAEDAGHTSGDTGVFVLGVRNDNGTTAFSGTNLDYTPIATDSAGRLWAMTAANSPWTITHAPAAAAQATISRASAGAGLKNVMRGFMVSVIASGAVTAETVIVNIRDGATGAGTVLWSAAIEVPTLAGAGTVSGSPFGVSGLYLPGTAATAMTIESSAAPGANIAVRVNAWGEVSA